MQLNLTIRQIVVLGEVLEDAARQQQAWIDAQHTSPAEREAAREKLVVIRSIQGVEA